MTLRLLALAAASGLLVAHAALAALEFDGLIELQTSYSVAGGQDFHRARVAPSWRFETSSWLTGYFELRYDYDVADSLVAGATSDKNRHKLSKRWWLDERQALGIREAYLDINAQWGQLRIGKQQIVWGEADGIKLLDVINPQSYAEFALADFEDSRIPLWAVNTTVWLGNNTLQLIWQPDTSYHEFVPLRSTYDIPAASQLSTIDPPSDSEWALRYETSLARWQVGFYYAERYADQPILVAANANLTKPPKLRHQRQRVVGFAANRPFGDFVLRLESALTYDQAWLAPSAQRSVLGREHASLLGLDWALSGNRFLSLQYRYTASQNTEQRIPNTLERAATLVARQQVGARLLMEMLVAVDLNTNGGFARFSTTYALTSTIDINLRLSGFFYDEPSVFSALGPQDHVLLGITFNF